MSRVFLTKQSLTGGPAMATKPREDGIPYLEQCAPQKTEMRLNFTAQRKLGTSLNILNWEETRKEAKRTSIK